MEAVFELKLLFDGGTQTIFKHNAWSPGRCVQGKTIGIIKSAGDALDKEYYWPFFFAQRDILHRLD